MTIIACPKCHDEVRAPERAPESAIVRCPLCAEEYRLGDALKQLPPELIVVSGMDAASKSDPYMSPADAGYEADDYRVAGMDAGLGGGVFDTAGPGSSGIGVSPPVVKGVRRKRKEKSMVAEMVKVVLGGVVGCSLAIPIIWWFGHTDPFELGPMVSPYAPWAVPAQFHAKPKNTTTTATTDSGQSNLADSSMPANSGGQTKSKQPGLKTMDDLNTSGGFDPDGKFAAAAAGGVGGLGNSPDPLAVDPLSSGPNLAPLGGNAGVGIADPLAPETKVAPEEPALLPNIGDSKKPAAPEEPVLGDPLAALTGPSLEPKVEQPQVEEPKNTPPKGNDSKKNGKRKSNPPAVPDLADLIPPATSAPPEPVNEANLPTPADLSASVKAAVTARDAYAKAEAEKAKGEVRRDLGEKMFADISAIGPILARLSVQDADNADAVAALDELLHGFGDTKSLTILAYFADNRLANDSTAEGILLAGTVKDFKAVGGAFETTVELANKKRSVQVVTFQSPQDTFKIGDRALILGRIVRDPKANLKGYEGDEALVVASSFALDLPPE